MLGTAGNYSLDKSSRNAGSSEDDDKADSNGSETEGKPI